MVAIKDMEMPNYCFECFFYDEFDGFCRILSASKWEEYIQEINHSDYDWKYEKRADICPLIEIEERKQGKWVFTKTIFDKYGCTAECPSCHKKWKTYDEIRFEKENKFCPNCGNRNGRC